MNKHKQLLRAALPQLQGRQFCALEIPSIIKYVIEDLSVLSPHPDTYLQRPPMPHIHTLHSKISQAC